ncbi:Serine/threonine-protein kinase pkn1 [Caulifigura coniformis]|uniref:Serine/threonine-protein kinase pkn1 n=1 Tax=Caulifigura coniformis TaxID=2527983 RepID=A0A517SBS0_9PLAN|nr:formylglycine-generating enzyme family protein [Caulifigura coniformis]QDT53554.1 Serine/threonine-protein kinase pkn1 [Caulifigura coniformis]
MRSLFRMLFSAAVLTLMAGATACGAESPAHLKLLKTFVDEFVEITPGVGRFPKSFQQGGEQPAREVTFAYSFSIAKYEVPQNLYEAVMGSNPSRWKGPRNSVESMSWEEANDFCEKATARLRAVKLIGNDDVIRLPSESEWEYCCRAGTTTTYSFGDEAQATGDVAPKATLLDQYAWHTGNAAGNDPAVGVLKPNPWGLYDVHGYLWEYCSDDWHADSSGAPTDGTPWRDTAESNDKPASRRVMRGGSWKDDSTWLRSSSRRAIGPSARNDAIGFRCVLSRG